MDIATLNQTFGYFGNGERTKGMQQFLHLLSNVHLTLLLQDWTVNAYPRNSMDVKRKLIVGNASIHALLKMIIHICTPTVLSG